jgi:hypothetical protein
VSQSALPLAFGLAARDSAERITVEWSSGVAQEFSNVFGGRYWLKEGSNLQPEKWLRTIATHRWMRT